MKHKLFKTSLFFAFATPVALAASTSYIAVQNTKTTAKVETKAPSTKNTTKLNEATNAATKTLVTFTTKSGQTDVTFTGNLVVPGKVGRPFCSIMHPTAMWHGYTQSYWIDLSTGKQVRNDTPITADMKVYPYFEADVELQNCLTISAMEHSIVTIVNHGTNTSTTRPNLLYSTDGYSWKDVPDPAKVSDPSLAEINILPGGAIYLKGNNPTGFNHSSQDYTGINIAGSVNLSGNVMTLLDDGKGTTKSIPNSYCFTRLFENASGVRAISSNFLPAGDPAQTSPGTLQPYCYESMFKGCTYLQNFPSYLLPATTLAEGCYKSMFAKCTSVTAVSPSLLKGGTNGGSLAKNCYYQMFEGCTSISEIDATDAPILPATTLAEGCYSGMFEGCTGLTTLTDADQATPNTKKVLPATSLAPKCYYGMFANCIALNNIATPTTLLSSDTDLTGASHCYDSMFYNTGITSAPALPATILEEGCYYAMFYNCSGLLTCPTLSPTTGTYEMVKECYAYMFYGCTSIVQMPTLSATSLAESCYDHMFYNCTSFNPSTGGGSTMSLPADTLQTGCYQSMFGNCTAMKTAPSIGTSTVTLASSCCLSMFQNSGITASPALTATTANNAPYCYENMFADCTSITSIGMISLTTITNSSYACYLMFSACSSVQIKEDTSATTYFFHCTTVNNSSEALTNMFQKTKGKEASPYPAKVNYYYSVVV